MTPSEIILKDGSGGDISSSSIFEVYYLLARLPLSSSAIIFVLLIAILSQIGDLFESSMKRRLGIKDSGQIVPGHGGALDRFDGYLTSLPVAAIMLHFEFPLLANLATL